MNNLTTFTLEPLTIPLTRKDQEIALNIAQVQLTKEKQKQAYMNALSVLVVKHYLDILGIESDFANSDISQPLKHLTEDISDLKIIDQSLGKQGLLECRYCLEDEVNIYIPFEALEDKIAYVFIQFDSSFQEGIILGFSPTVSQEQITINQLKPIQEFIKFLYEPEINWIYLRDWLDHQFTRTWLSVEEAMKSPQVSPKFAFRIAHNRRGIHQVIKKLDVKINLESPISDLVQIIQTTNHEETRWEAIEVLRQIEPHHPAIGVRRIYQLQEALNISVALMVAIVPISHQKVAILLKVYPIGVENNLPPQLTLSLFKGTDELLREVVARTNPLDISIQLKFVAFFGTKITIEVSLSESIFREYFIV